MKRDLNKLSDNEYDVVVVGGGVYGMSVAWDAVLRGLRVALIEKNDFAGATSSNSLKIIHGGLRYLQQLDFKRMRESVHERMALMKIAPHLVFPLPVVMPTYSYKSKSRLAMFLALLANDLISFDRNKLNDTDKYLPGSRLISEEEFKKYVPGYEKADMSGGALWYDCQCRNTERLVISYALSAAELGADIINYVKCLGFLKHGNKVIGIKARDFFSGDTFDIRAKIIVNASGPWIDEVLEKISGEDRKTRFIHSSAINIVIKKKILAGVGAGLPGLYQYKKEDGSIVNGSQILFFVPWKDYTIIGTRHLPCYKKLSDYRVREFDILEFLKIINQAYPRADVRREEVCFFHGGLLPMTGIKRNSEEVRLENQYRIYDHLFEDKIDGVVSVIGVKYTTHRHVASKTIDLIFKKLGKTSPECTTADKPVYGGDIEKFEDYLRDAVNGVELDKKITSHLVRSYGSKYTEILGYINEDAGLAQTITGSDEVIKAEVVNSVRNEMALKLTDVILRRTDLGSEENPGDEALEIVAQIMAKELAWDDTRIEKEIDEARDKYVPVIDVEK